MRRNFVMGLALSGCAGAEETAPSGDDDTAAMTWSSEEPAPLLTNEEVADLLSELAATGAPNGYDISMDWLEHLARGDERCPGDEAFLDRPAAACSTTTEATSSSSRLGGRATREGASCA